MQTTKKQKVKIKQKFKWRDKIPDKRWVLFFS